MSDATIVSVWYPVGDPVQPLIAHAVGRDGVTKITLEGYSTEPYCSREYLMVFVGDQVRWRLDPIGAGIEFAPGRASEERKNG